MRGPHDIRIDGDGGGVRADGDVGDRRMERMPERPGAVEERLDPAGPRDLVETADDGLEELGERVEPLPVLDQGMAGGVARTAHFDGHSSTMRATHCAMRSAGRPLILEQVVDRAVRVDRPFGDADDRAVDAFLTKAIAKASHEGLTQ